MPNDTIELPESFFATDKSEEDTSPAPDAENESPELEDEDNSDEEPETEDEENEEDEAGDEDQVDEDEDEEDESEDEDKESDEETPEDEETFLPKPDLKKIKADPELNKAYNHMRAAFTKAMMDARKVERESVAMKDEFNQFAESLATDEGAEDFLVRVALGRPEVYERALERARELTDDPDERARYDREQKVKAREVELERREKANAVEENEKRVAQIEGLVARTAKRFDMDEEDLRIAQEYVANEILKIRANGGKEIPTESVIAAVKRAAHDLNLKQKKVEEKVSRTATLQERARAKAKARKSRPTPPRSAAAPAVRRQTVEVPKDVDPLEFAIERGLGVNK